MWQALIPVVANLVAKNNPNAADKINSAAQVANLAKGLLKK